MNLQSFNQPLVLQHSMPWAFSEDATEAAAQTLGYSGMALMALTMFRNLCCEPGFVRNEQILKIL